MKHIFAFLSLVAFVFSGGCSKEAEVSFSSEFSVAVIETTQQDNKSVITFYDSELANKGKVQFNLGSMGSYHYPPKIYQNYMYVVPQGIGNQKELKCVLELNLDNGDSKQYDLGLFAINGFDVTEQYIYAVNTVNYNSTLVRMDKTSKQTKTIEFPEIYIERIVASENFVFAFSVAKSSEGMVTSDLYKIDSQTLSLIAKYPVTEYGISHSGAVFHDGMLFFTNATKAAGAREEIPADTLVSFDPETNAFETVTLGAAYPAQIVVKGDQLWISHCNLITGEGKGISVYNTKTDEIVKIDLTHNVSQMQIRDESLFATDGENLYMYRVDGSGLQLEKNVNATTKKSGYYISGLFANK